MEPKRPRKLELLASRIEPRLWQYELILLAFMAASLALYYFRPSWAGAGALLLGGGLILAIIYFFRWFLPRPEGQEWNSGIHKLHSAALAFGVLGGVFRVLYMQSDLLFLSISLALSVLASLTVLYRMLVKGEPPAICKPDLARMVLCLIAVSVLLLWHPPLPITDINLFPAEELLQ